MLQSTPPDGCESILTRWVCYEFFVLGMNSKLQRRQTAVVSCRVNYEQCCQALIGRVAFVENANCQVFVESIRTFIYLLFPPKLNVVKGEGKAFTSVCV